MIKFIEADNIFVLNTNRTSYIFGVLEKQLIHIYYGAGIDNTDGIMQLWDKNPGCGFIPSKSSCGFSTESIRAEFPVYGNTDLRNPAFHAVYKDGSSITDFEYTGYKISDGKPGLAGLPAIYAEKGDKAQTLEIYLEDKLTGLKAVLQYSVLEDYDAITRSVKIINGGADTVNIKNIMSCSVDFEGKEYDFMHLSGTWARERHIERVPLLRGNCSVESRRGASSHVHNPFFAMLGRNTNEEYGEAYGFSLVYSGNFVAGAETDQFDIARAYIGINPFGFGWRLESGEEFQSPETVMVYSDKGLGGMSNIYHKLYRERLCRGYWRDKERPVLLNNWEATYFNFDEEKIVNIAKKAKEVGVELMVLDDGWFGKRDNDDCSLGDWVSDRRKLPQGVEHLARRINDEVGMKFGLWFEPEMVSPDSDLYRAHPDWCLHVNGRERNMGRNQLILDLSRKEVCDYIVKALSDVLGAAPISYVKWDMNRNMTDIGSDGLPAERQAEVAHRYMLGLYGVLEELTAKFPEVLFEGCSGGGGRFDPGMLYYSTQIWTSDNSDAIERLYIQYGTSMAYPASTMGAHVSAVPNHQVGRITPLKTRGNVAMCGQFGYELDLNSLTDGEIEEVKEQIKQYKQIGEVVHKGTMHRLKSPFEGNYSAVEFVSEDENTVFVCICSILSGARQPVTRIKLRGLDENAVYSDGEKSYSGAVLMKIGLKHRCEGGDFSSETYILKKQ